MFCKFIQKLLLCTIILTLIYSSYSIASITTIVIFFIKQFLYVIPIFFFCFIQCFY
nr:MAG TPA: hypothetical protein [Caudoviricetes sp.]